MTVIVRLAAIRNLNHTVRVLMMVEEEVRCRLKASISVFYILYQSDHLVSYTRV
jgi:hypothetical protein